MMRMYLMTTRSNDCGWFTVSLYTPPPHTNIISNKEFRFSLDSTIYIYFALLALKINRLNAQLNPICHLLGL